MYYRDKNGNKIDGKNIEENYIQENYGSKNIYFKIMMATFAGIFGWFIISIILVNLKINENLKTIIPIIIALVASIITGIFV